MRRLLFLMILVNVHIGLAAQPGCLVLDPELQGSYEGGCDRNGFADGNGIAKGRAEYSGRFSEGKKHGYGVKTWPGGDRYAGDFINDRMEGYGDYTWGKNSPWVGQHYKGQYQNDSRHGQGIYEWPSGDRYEGAWKDNQMIGPPTPMQQLQSQRRTALIKAVAKAGTKVCQDQESGLRNKENISGIVVEVTESRVGIQIETADGNIRLINGENINPGKLIWDEAFNWYPCY